MKSQIHEHQKNNYNSVSNTAYEIVKVLLFAMAFILVVSCSGGRYANSGTASDRTGTNGATNGTGKAPTDNTHNYRPR